MKKLWLLLFGILFLISGCGGASVASDIPQPDGHLTDAAKALTPQVHQRIEDDLFSYQQRTGNEVAVLLVKTTGNESIENYAVDVFAKWGIGEKGKDNGVLLLLAMEDRKGRIEVGYGLEGDLTDIEAKAIYENQIRPRLKADDPNEAVLAGEVNIRSALGDPQVEALAPPTPQPSSGGLSSWAVLAIILGIGIFGLIAGLSDSRNRFAGGTGGTWYGTSGGWGTGSSGGGGFDGFGGGSSGGGGASGDW